MRGGGVNPGLLGIDGTLSEDVVRQAMMRINETQGLEWLTQQVVSSIAPELKLPWILDIDVTFKPLYAHQQCADWGRCKVCSVIVFFANWLPLPGAAERRRV